MSSTEPDSTPLASAGDELVIPREGVTEGRLRFTVGVENLEFVAEEGVEGLCHVHLSKPRPAVTVTGSTVHLRYPRLRGWSRRADPTVVRLNPEIPWTVEIDGAAGQVSADLRHGVLAGFAVRGSAGDLALRLGVPRGTVALRFGKSVSGLRIQRPAAVPVRVYIQGGASKARFDDQHFGGMSGPVHWQSPGFEAADDRYDIAIAGSASGPAVEGVA